MPFHLGVLVFFLSLRLCLPTFIPKQVVGNCIHSMSRIGPLPLLLPLILVHITCLSHLACGQSLLLLSALLTFQCQRHSWSFQKWINITSLLVFERPQWFLIKPNGKVKFLQCFTWPNHISQPPIHPSGSALGWPC